MVIESQIDSVLQSLQANAFPIAISPFRSATNLHSQDFKSFRTELLSYDSYNACDERGRERKRQGINQEVPHLQIASKCL
jgi:hypothetical protein